MTNEEWARKLDSLTLEAKALTREMLEDYYTTAMMNWSATLDRLERRESELRMARSALHILVITGLALGLGWLLGVLL